MESPEHKVMLNFKRFAFSAHTAKYSINRLSSNHWGDSLQTINAIVRKRSAVSELFFLLHIYLPWRDRESPWIKNVHLGLGTLRLPQLLVKLLSPLILVGSKSIAKALPLYSGALTKITEPFFIQDNPKRRNIVLFVAYSKVVGGWWRLWSVQCFHIGVPTVFVFFFWYCYCGFSRLTFSYFRFNESATFCH